MKLKPGLAAAVVHPGQVIEVLDFFKTFFFFITNSGAK
jgi:hypothetical protein